MVLIIASYADIRTREVPDWLSYGFLFAVLGIRTIFSFQLSWNILIEGILGFAVFFLLALLFYYTNQWGGGDSKLLMGMGAVIGISLPLSITSWNLAWFFFSLLLLGAFYGLLWILFAAIRKWSDFSQEIKTKLGKNRKIQLFLVVLLVIFSLLGILVHPFLFLGAFPITIYYLLLLVTIVEKSCFLREVKVSKLTEGDWLAKPVIVKGERLLRRKTLLKRDIDLLKKKVSSVVIKEGVPFVPSFLLAYLLLTFGSGVFKWVLGIFG